MNLLGNIETVRPAVGDTAPARRLTLAPVASMLNPGRGLPVVVVAYNAGRFLRRCVAAVLDSSIPTTVVVVDNASDDGSIEALGRCYHGDPRVRILRNSENLGFAAASNRALRLIGGKYLVFLNPDCFVQKDSLQRLREQMDDRPRMGMAGCLVRNPDGSEQAGARRSIPTPWRTFVRILHLDRLFPGHPRFRNFMLDDQPLPESPLEVEGISGACMFVRRAAMKQVGPLDEGYFLHCEDLDWFMRFRARGWGILFVPDVQVTHVKGGCSGRHPLRVLWHKHKGMVRFYRKFFRHQYPTPLMWGVVIAIWTRFSVLAAADLVGRSSDVVRSRLRGQAV